MTHLDRLLAPGALSPVFQPIYDMAGGGARLHSVEGLMRGPRGTNLERADVLFDYVRRKHAEIPMDRACVRGIFAAVKALPPGVCFSVNIHAATLSRDPQFLDFVQEELQRHGIPAPRLTFEIVEHAPDFADRRLRAALEGLRRAGMRIALDDVGLGLSNFRMMVDIEPQYFKIDRYFVRGSLGDPHRSVVLECVALMAERFSALVVAEGVESRDDLDSCLAHGIHLIQGHLLAAAVPGSEISDAPRPLPESPRVAPASLAS